MIAALSLALVAVAQTPAQNFDHLEHKALFPSCTSCHLGAAQEGDPLWPEPASCAACHDGTIEKTVVWRPRSPARRTNLRFDHLQHAAAAAAKNQPATCAGCHTEAGRPRMAVRGPVVQRCLDCHGIRVAHLAAPDSACSTCHVALARAATLTRRDVAGFRAPPSHANASFLSRNGHGAVSRETVERSCATCHAREFCYQCHAGTAPPRAVAWLSTDQRSTAIAARAAPASHGANFADRHANEAAASTARCAGCHVRADCLECHRPDAAAAGGYHPDGFLARHPAAAYARENSCSDCHNVGSFCTSCHARGGVAAGGGVLRSGYHDTRQFFLAGHGQAARQGLESCASCHAERDCLTCHSAVGGRRFNPHGPGFDPGRLRRKNFEMCTVCHATAVPER